MFELLTLSAHNIFASLEHLIQFGRLYSMSTSSFSSAYPFVFPLPSTCSSHSDASFFTKCAPCRHAHVSISACCRAMSMLTATLFLPSTFNAYVRTAGLDNDENSIYDCFERCCRTLSGIIRSVPICFHFPCMRMLLLYVGMAIECGCWGWSTDVVRQGSRAHFVFANKAANSAGLCL